MRGLESARRECEDRTGGDSSVVAIMPWRVQLERMLEKLIDILI